MKWVTVSFTGQMTSAALRDAWGVMGMGLKCPRRADETHGSWHTLGKMCKNCTFRGTTACHWGSTLERTPLYLIYPWSVHNSTTRVHITTLRVRKVQKCPFESSAPVTSCCTPKGTIFVHFSGHQLTKQPINLNSPELVLQCKYIYIYIVSTNTSSFL